MKKIIVLSITVAVILMSASWVGMTASNVGPRSASNKLPPLHTFVASRESVPPEEEPGGQSALLPGLAMDDSGNIFIANIALFLDTCPASDPAIAEIRNDFQIRKNQLVVGDIACTEPTSQIPIAQYTDELIALQVLRVIYYMDRGKSGHLPWTPGTLYNWMKSKIKGV